MTTPLTSACLIVPCFNEEAVLPEFHRRVTDLAEAHPAVSFTWLFVDDCSVDRTPELLAEFAARDDRVQVLRLASNRGHQIAVTAGLDFADADVVIIIDADLQDPPEVVPEMIELIAEGYDVVHAQRRRRPGESWFKLATASAFYRLLGRVSKTEIVPDAGDFRAVSRRVVAAAKAFREPHRFMRGLFAQIGFRQCILRYERDERHAGETKYSLRKMLKLSADALMSFSSAPIRAIAMASLFLWACALAYLAYNLVLWVRGVTEPGWTSIVLLMTFYTGLILLCIAVVGAYVGRIFEQGQQRPLYWLEDAKNVDLSRDSEIAYREPRLSAGLLGLTRGQSRPQPRIIEAKATRPAEPSTR